MIRQAARDFAMNECLPGVIERDELQKFPQEQIEKLADLGFMGMFLLNPGMWIILTGTEKLNSSLRPLKALS